MKILVADDSAVNRHLLEAFLRDWGYEVTLARDGAEAWPGLGAVARQGDLVSPVPEKRLQQMAVDGGIVRHENLHPPSFISRRTSQERQWGDTMLSLFFL